MLTAPWPWWLAALALAAVSLLHWRLSGRLLGGSGAWVTLVNLREERRLAKEEAGLADDPAALQAAMLAATLAQFAEAGLPPPELPAAPPAEEAPAAPVGRSPWTAHLAYLLALAAGGAVASVAQHGGFTWRWSLGDVFARLYGSGPGGLALLFGGGLLVGLGVRMAGGCTIGHGLNGCSRLQPGSLATTGALFATAVVVALSAARLLGAP